MTKAEILAYTRQILNESSTEVGSKLSDAGNLLGFIDDGAEQVVVDLLAVMPEVFCKTETKSLVAGTESYTFTQEFWMVYKVEKNVSGDNPVPVDIISPLQADEIGTVGETADEPTAVYFLGNTMYVRPIPASAKTNYLKVYLVVPEAATIATAGPTYIPRPAHRMICYWAASLAAIAYQIDPSPFQQLYAARLVQVRDIWHTFQHQAPMFLRGSYVERRFQDARDKALYDRRWP